MIASTLPMALLLTLLVAPAANAQELNDLPLVEAPAGKQTDDETRSQALAVILTGDGGWAGLDRAMAAEFTTQGVSTVGFNTLKYFWTARTPEQTATDLARVLTHYLQVWNKSRVILVGYSFGADVLPFAVRRLPPELRQRIASVNFLGLSSSALFEIHVSTWLTGGPPGLPVIPEIEALQDVPMLCLYGEGEEDALCPQLTAPGVTRAQIGHGHHFSGEYAALARRILEYAAQLRGEITR